MYNKKNTSYELFTMFHTKKLKMDYTLRDAAPIVGIPSVKSQFK